MPQRESDAILGDLRRNRRSLARMARLLEQRRELFVEGRSRVPQITFQQLARAAGVTVPAVIQALRRHDAHERDTG